MAYKDLQEFVDILEREGELVRIKTQVDAELEITEIADRVSKAYGPALLFENVRGYDIPVLINAFGSTKRMAMSLGVDRIDDVAEDIVGFMEIADQVPQSTLDKVKLLPKLAQVAKFIPRLVRQGSCQEVVEKNPSLNALPVLKCWPEDAGRFITLPQVYTRDPETGKRNVGISRMPSSA